MLKFWISTDKVMEICKDENYYTHGDTIAYGNMLSKCEDVLVSSTEELEDVLYEIAKDIQEHSRTNVPSIKVIGRDLVSRAVEIYLV